MIKKIQTNVEYDEDIRCSYCSKLLARSKHGSDVCEVKCNRCGVMNLVFWNMHDQIIITDTDGKILFANKLVEEITGYAMKEILGNKPSLWGKQMSESFYKEMWHSIKVEGRCVDVVVNNKRKDGQLYKARLKISPVFDSSDNIEFFVGIESVINKNKS